MFIFLLAFDLRSSMLFAFGALVIFGATTILIGATAAEWDSVKSKIFDNYHPANPAYENMLLNVLKNDFVDSKLNVVFVSDHCLTCNRILSTLMEDLRHPFLTVSKFDQADICFTEEKMDFRVEYNSTVHGFVILVMNNFNDLFLEFEKLREWCSWNPRAKHFVVTLTEPNQKELQLFFEKCWTHQVISVGVTIYNKYDGYTYNPYLNKLPYETVNGSRLFYDKLRNMMGYRIPVKYIPSLGKNVAKWVPEENKFTFPGMDWGHAETFFKSLNATPNYINLTNEDVTRFLNFTFRFSYWRQHEFDHNAQLWFNPLLTNFRFQSRFEPAYPLGFNGVYIMTPKSGLQLPNMFKPYTNLTWISVGVSLMVCSLYTKLLYKRKNINDDAFMSSYGMFLGQYYPKRNFEQMEKGVYLLWSIYSLLILNAYQGALYSALATVSFYPEMNTIAELPLRTHTVYTYENLEQIVKEHVPSGITVIPSSTKDYQIMMKNNRDDFYAFTKSTVDFAVKRARYSENGVPFYHVMDESLVPMHMLYFVPYGSPYLDKLNRITLACSESGLNKYWNDAVDLQGMLDGTTVVFEDQSKKLKKLSMRTQVLAFYIWAVGLVISLCSCLYEVYFSIDGKRRSK